MACILFFMKQMLAILGRKVKVTLEVLPLVPLRDQTCARYQRSLRPAALKRLIDDELNPLAAMFLVVSRREKGLMAVVDGNHRLWMLIEKGLSKWPCMVVHGLTEVEEAQLWEAFNSKRCAPTTVDRLKAKVIARHADALDLCDIVRDCGFRFPFTETTNGESNAVPITAVGSIQQSRALGFLEVVLGIIHQAWPGDKDSVASSIISGLNTFLRSPGAWEKLHKDKLVKALAAQAPRKLLQKARNASSGEMVSTTIARILATDYNKNLGKPDKVLTIYTPGLRASDVPA